MRERRRGRAGPATTGPVLAAITPRTAVWHHWSPGLLALGVWTEKAADKGEDAEPLVLHDRSQDTGLLAVFDGVGGAGAGVGRTAQGIERSNAWVGSRVARGLAEDWFATTGRHDSPEAEHSLDRHLARRLGELRGARRGRISGSMRRDLPTTAAAVHYAVRAGEVVWEVLWAGDSRCYVLESGRGLQQLSRDDTESDDALTLLTQDPPMTNMVCANRPFTIHSVPGRAATPCLLVCATDGFFGYLDTPAEFEFVLLDALANAGDVGEWSALLASSVSSYTGDDASIAVVALGYDRFDELRAAFARRRRELLTGHVKPVRRRSDRESLVAARAESWSRYRGHYERRMPSREGDRDRETG
ncbi:protein phosphatase 2C domain-containing protein [Saccharopolyspora gloriosae]|uniref:protein phosphatase 2C domain-containing protein n=1 Tax=Saccharopolyspora gloriosae TaxID=455344 RepID=UPI001FB5A990|nr:protein phosphatase 2C domain-containing protein [Saccharopolyspora gloriosae]